MQPTVGKPDPKEVSSGESEESTKERRKRERENKVRKRKMLRKDRHMNLDHLFLKNWPHQKRTR